MKTFKICLMGAFSVGKSSLVRRFVHEVFDERYITTLGVTIETREVSLDTGTVKLIIWDMEGADGDDSDQELVTSRMEAYLRGVNGVMLVADGTRPVTVNTALRLYDWLEGKWPDTPSVLLLNKSDLKDQWRVAPEETATGNLQCFNTSALSGMHVEAAFSYLARNLDDKL